VTTVYICRIRPKKAQRESSGLEKLRNFEHTIVFTVSMEIRSFKIKDVLMFWVIKMRAL
jgi:hypothetical protein